MNPIKQKLIDSIAYRLSTEIATQNPVKFLQKLPLEEFIDIIIATTYLYTRTVKGKPILFTEVICGIGHNIRNKYKLKKDSALAAKSGAFLLYSFEDLNILEVHLGSPGSGHAAYLIKVLNDEHMTSLWSTVTATRTEKLPSLAPHEEWTAAKHSTGAKLVKTNDKDVLSKLTPETHPIVFNCINKAQKVGWKINLDVYDLQIWALRNKTAAFNDIWSLTNVEAKASKIREAKAISDIAKRFLYQPFYHMYYCDFRYTGGSKIS